MNQLENKTAVVTGGTRGIGFAIAKKYVENGAHVVLVGTNEERGAEAVKALEHVKVAADQKIGFKKVNVADHEAVAAFAKEVADEWDVPDIVVNCAGITRDNLLMKIKEDDWDNVLETNLKSVYNTAHAFSRGMMKKRAGSMINITSVIGLMGNPGQTNYAASKAGMIGFTRSLAKELASRNICVNCIAPGFIETDMTDKLTDDQKEGILKQVPMKRLGQAEEIASAALFLASDGARYITGQTITVDGGMTA